MQKEKRNNIKEKMQRARRRLWEPKEGIQRERMESGKAERAAIKGPKRVKKPGACRPQSSLGLGVSRLAVDSPLLYGPCKTNTRVECDHFVW